MSNRKAGYAAALIVPALVWAPGAAAARAPVNEWFCKVLKSPFDPVAAIKAFPLEKLPDPVESERSRGEGEDKVIYREWTASGENFEVEYSYGYRESNVSQPFGFGLRVKRESYDDAAPATALKWLREFGKPVESIMGQKVSAGPPIYKGGDQVFYFQTWDGTGTYSANWFNAKDIQHAAELCR